MIYYNRDNGLNVNMSNYDSHSNHNMYTDFGRRTLSSSWRSNGVNESSGTNFNDDRSSHIHMRGPIRALEVQYYNKFRRKYSRQMRMPINKSQTNVIKTTVQNLNLDCVRPQRAGVILYSVVNGAVYIGLGLDSRTHELTDFAGNIVYKFDGTCVNGGLREFDEETLSIFDPLTLSDVSQCPVIYDNRNLVIFLHIDIDPETISSAFNRKYEQVAANMKPSLNAKKQRHSEPEVCGITWLTWEEFQNSIQNRGILYSRVQRFLAAAGDFGHLL